MVENRKYNAVVTKIELSDRYPRSYFAICETKDFGEIKIFVSKKVLDYNEVDLIKTGDELFIIKSYNKFNQKMWVVKDVKK